VDATRSTRSSLHSTSFDSNSFTQQQDRYMRDGSVVTAIRSRRVSSGPVSCRHRDPDEGRGSQ